MATSRDDFVIAIRSAFLKKSNKQKFSLLTLVFLSILIIILSSLDIKLIRQTKNIINEIVYRSSLIVSYPENLIVKSINEIIDYSSFYEEYKKSIIEIENLKSENINVQKIAKDIIQHFLRHAVRDGFFHADMHQGNLFVTKDGNIIPVDFGIMGRLDKNNRKYLAEILYGFIKRDYKKVAEVHFIAGLVPKEVSKDEFAQALRSIGEPIFGQSVKNISGGKLLAQLFEITEKFNMQTQIQLLLLQKTMVVVEGVARNLDPDTNIWNISRPVLEDWLQEIKDPINKAGEVINEASEVLKKLPDLPIIMDRANDVMALIAEGKFNPNSLTYNSLREEELKLELMRNKILGGILVLVIFVLLVFK